MVIAVGTIIPYGGTSAPTGYLLCDGSAVSRTTYSALYAAIGTTFGSGDGSTTFNVPDLRGRVPAGKDNMGGTAASRLTSTTMSPDGNTVGATGGEQTHTLSTAELASHSHTATVTDPGHHHSVYSSNYSGNNNYAGLNSSTISGVMGEVAPSADRNYFVNSNVGTQVIHDSTTGITVSNTNTGSGNAHNNVQPAIILSYIIATVTDPGGAVTSVAMTGDGTIFNTTVSGSPITSSGTLAPSLLNQSVNSVLAGPSSGSAAAPTFRALVGADLPNPSSSSLGGIQSFAAVSHKWINAISTSGVPSATQPDFSDLTGTASSSQLPSNQKLGAVGTVIDGGGAVINTGQKGYILCPYSGTITSATLIADQSGSCVIDVWKAAYPTIPTVSNSIVASDPPTLSSSQKSQDTTLTGWTTSVSAGDVIGFNVNSASTITRVMLELGITKS